MDRVYKSGAQGVAPLAAENASGPYPTAGVPGVTAPTKPGPFWYHMVMEELLALVTDAGIAFDKTVFTQVRDAVRALVANFAQPMSEMTFKVSNNVADATNDIDFAAGKCRSSDDTTNLVGGAMTKQIDAVWAGGTGAGGRCSAEALVNGTWFLYAFKRTTGGAGVDYCFSQLLAPALPDTATKSRRIGAWLREGGVLVPMKITGDYSRRTTSVLDRNANNPGVAAVTATLSVPLLIEVQAHVTVGAEGSSAANHYVSPLDAADEAPDHSLGQGWAPNVDAVGVAGEGLVKTNTSGQVRSRLSASSASVNATIRTLGWIDRRGRDG